jgi:hypothetical protein
MKQMKFKVFFQLSTIHADCHIADRKSVDWADIGQGIIEINADILLVVNFEKYLFPSYQL